MALANVIAPPDEVFGVPVDVEKSGSFTAGTQYYNITHSEMGIPTDVKVQGIALRIITGNQSIDHDGSLEYSDSSGSFIYNCHASNSTKVKFRGVIFCSYT